MSIELSVIIPVHSAHETLGRALRSIANQTIRDEKIEAIISVDDGRSYEPLLRDFPFARSIHGKAINTGSAQARNRGVREARGAYLGFLDADDRWGESCAEQLLHQAQKHGAAFSPLRVQRGERAVCTIDPGSTIRLRHFGSLPCSFVPVVERSLSPPFRPGKADDVRHSMEVVGRLNNSAPCVESPYTQYLHDTNISSESSYPAQVDAVYEEFIQQVRSGATAIPPRHRAEACRALMQRRAWNRLYSERADGRHFYEFFATA